MAVQTINIGNRVNDGLGDDLRTAFGKVNANFVELQNSIIVTASNAAGSNGAGIVANGTGANLTFKNLIAGNKISLESFTDSIRINATQPVTFSRIDTNSGFVIAENYENITIQGGTNITVSAADQVITVDTTRNLEALLTTLDFGPITQNFSTTIQFSLSAANIDFGTVVQPGDFYIDFGGI